MIEKDHLGDWSPEKDSSHPDDLFQSRYVTPGFKPFSYNIIIAIIVILIAIVIVIFIINFITITINTVTYTQRPAVCLRLC